MVALAIAVAVCALVLLAAALVWRGSRRLPRRATVVELENETSVDPSTEAVTSIQKADLLIDRDALQAIWTPVHLERLARTYWRFLSRVTLGLIHVRYSERERFVVFLAPPLRLLTFQAPEYEMDASHGLVRWRISKGLLVSRRGRDGHGYLQIEVRRAPGAGGPAGGEAAPGSGGGDGGDDTRARLHVEVAVVNFYPSIASGLGRTIYNVTQSRIHVIVTYGFLRSLTRLDLAESRVGRMRDQ
jgi:hypothetical protein